MACSIRRDWCPVPRYDGFTMGNTTPTDFLVYPLAVDEKGRTVRVEGVQDETTPRWEDRTEGTLRRFQTPLILPTSISLCRRVFLRLLALWQLYIVPFSPLSIAKREMGIPLI